VIEQVTKAWQFIFSHHPRGDAIMIQIIERPESITTNLFRKWFHEAQGGN
jgi:hypothetical protein